MLRMYAKHCTSCGAIEYVNLFPTYYDLVRGRIEELIADHRLAVFGCGNIWKMFYSAGEVFHNQNYEIVDETPFLQKEGWNGHNVYSPAVLEEHGIDTLLVMLRISKKEIEEKIREKYKIKQINIVMCYDLLS